MLLAAKQLLIVAGVAVVGFVKHLMGRFKTTTEMPTSAGGSQE